MKETLQILVGDEETEPLNSQAAAGLPANFNDATGREERRLLGYTAGVTSVAPAPNRATSEKAAVLRCRPRPKVCLNRRRSLHPQPPWLATARAREELGGE